MNSSNFETEYNFNNVSHSAQKKDACIQVEFIIPNQISLTIMDLIRNEKEFNDWTGIEKFTILSVIEQGIEKILLENSIKISESTTPLKYKIILVFIKIKTNITFGQISSLFGISNRTASRYFSEILPLLKLTLSPFLYWPSKENISNNMPKCFAKFRNVRTILDCTEVQLPVLNCLNCRLATYSHYKGCQTIKSLIAVTPAGTISHVSLGYSGNSSDKFIVNQEKFLDKCEPFVDSVMVDKGFHIENECFSKNIKLVRPHFLRNKTQFTREEVLENNEISSARVHVERAIQRVKQNKIFQQKVDYYVLPYIDDIIFIICSLVPKCSHFG